MLFENSGENSETLFIRFQMLIDQSIVYFKRSL